MILLVRHASCEGLGVRLNGRGAEASLSAQGRVEAQDLAERLRKLTLTAVMSSPQTRCVQTAQTIAAAGGSQLQTSDDLDEVDFGAWTGKSFEELQRDPSWRDWNVRRSVARAPGGENMGEVQLRMRRALNDAMGRGGVVALVSHAEPIRAALANIIGFSLDAWARLDIAPAGVSRIFAEPLRVASINEHAF